MSFELNLSEELPNKATPLFSEQSPMRLIYRLLYFLLFFSAACSGVTSTPNPITGTKITLTPKIEFFVTEPNPQTPYPIGEQFATMQSGYPVPSQEISLDQITLIPTPASIQNATVTGVLLRQEDSSIEPVANRILSLGQVLYDDAGQPTLVKLESSTPLRTVTDINGKFVFQEVPIGEYVLVYDRIHDAYMLNDPETGGDFVFRAEGGQILDLGELVYESLPGQ